MDHVALFIIIGIGIVLGKVSYKGLSLDSSAVIFVAMFYGYFMFSKGVEFILPPIIQQTGLLLFIFTIGMQAGPTFFEVYRSQGLKLIGLAIFTVFTGAVTTFLLVIAFEVDPRIALGLFSGALTSTPGLAAAIETSGSSLASIGYGIAYPFGVVGVILFVKLAPKLFCANFSREEQKYLEENQISIPEVSHKNFIITNENADGRTIGELHIRMMTKANISRVLRANETSMPPAADLVLHKGDLVRAVGTKEALEKVELLLGHSTDMDIPESGMFELKWYVISKRNVVNRTLGELNLRENYKATVTRIRRAGIDLPARPSLKLRFGDRLYISSTKGNVKGLSLLFGDSMEEVETTSFLPVALGIVIGLMLGSIEIPLGGETTFSLGITGGVLLSALILSRIGKTGPILWNLPGTGNHILRQFGILLFLTPVGLAAGSHLGPTMEAYGFSLFAIGAIITLIPMILVVLIGSIFLKINFLSVLGALTGGMTSTPGLNAVDSMTNSAGPQVAYAAVYPFALVAIIVLIQLLDFTL